jgi:DNA-binding CsgD family transcriptional regulator
MMDRDRVEQRVRREIIRLCHTGGDARTLCNSVIRTLRTAMPIDAYFFATADPATLLFTGAVVDDVLARATPQFLQNEFLQEDVNKFTRLARSRRPVGGLAQATHGTLGRSPRYQEILAPLALGDELRAALVVDAACWGFLCLHREQASTHFTPTEASFLARLTPHIAEGLRSALLLGRTAVAQAPDGPGLLILSEGCARVASTAAADRWLAEVAQSDWPHTQELPRAVYAVAARLQELERGEHPAPGLLPRVRLRTASGRWLVLHASRLVSSVGEPQIAVILEEARPAEIAPLIVQAYDLSPREGEIAQLVLRGLSTAAMAEALYISPTTVQDHLKAIFDKVGVRSRRELVGQIFAQQYAPRLGAGARTGADGWFA